MNAIAEINEIQAQVRVGDVFPARRSYKAKQSVEPMASLPFVYHPKRNFKTRSNWKVTPTDNYDLACKLGEEYAAHYVQYMKDNSALAGSNVLGNIAMDIDFADKTAAKGYWIGFFSHLERLILDAAKRIDVFAEMDRRHAAIACRMSALAH